MFKRETNIETPTLTLRLKALAVDGALALLVAILFNFLISMLVGNFDTNYKNNYNLIATSIEESGLASTEDSSYFEKSYLVENDCGNFISIMEKFYINFLPTVDSSENYNVNYVNENILEIGTKDYFVYVNEGTEDRTKLGVLNPSYIDVSGGNHTVAFVISSFVNKKYEEACNKFYSLDLIINASNQMNFTNSSIKFGSYTISILVFFVFLPSFLKEGLGKKLFKVHVVDKNYKKPSFCTFLLRSVPAILCIGLYSFIPDSSVSDLFFFIAIAIGVGFIIFTKSNRAIHDFLAKTSVVKEGEEKPKDEVQKD